MSIVTRADLKELLLAWQRGEMTTRAVFEWAQEKYWPGDVEFDDMDDDSSSAANEVLSALDQLPMNLILPEDVPIYVELLEATDGDFSNSYEKFRASINRIDILNRRESLTSDEFYGPYCSPG